MLNFNKVKIVYLLIKRLFINIMYLTSSIYLFLLLLAKYFLLSLAKCKILELISLISF